MVVLLLYKSASSAQPQLRTGTLLSKYLHLTGERQVPGVMEKHITPNTEHV